MKLERTIITLPFFNLGLSKLWLYLITGIDYYTLSPLIDSLKYDLKANNSFYFNKYIPEPIKLNDSLQRAISNEIKQEKIPKKKNANGKKLRPRRRDRWEGGM